MSCAEIRGWAGGKKQSLSRNSKLPYSFSPGSPESVSRRFRHYLCAPISRIIYLDGEPLLFPRDAALKARNLLPSRGIPRPVAGNERRGLAFFSLRLGHEERCREGLLALSTPLLRGLVQSCPAPKFAVGQEGKRNPSPEIRNFPTLFRPSRRSRCKGGFGVNGAPPLQKSRHCWGDIPYPRVGFTPFSTPFIRGHFLTSPRDAIPKSRRELSLARNPATSRGQKT